MTDTNQEVREMCGEVELSELAELLIEAVQDTFDEGWRPADAVGPVVEVLKQSPLVAPPPAVPDAVGVREALRFALDESQSLLVAMLSEDRPKAEIAEQIAANRKALSSIEPTPSPEPQASNAGAVEALREKIARALNSVLGSEDDEHPRHHPAQNSWEEPSEVWWTQWLEAADAVCAALSTPGLQTSNAVSVEIEALRAENEAFREAARAMLNNWRFGGFYAPQQPEPLYVRKFARLLNEDGRLPPPLAALSTPEPQTGERDGEVKRLPVARVINDNQPNYTAIISIVCDPPTLPVGTLLYQRPRDHAAELVEAFQAGMRFAADDAERRLAEVEEIVETALTVLDNYAEPQAYTDAHGELYEADEEVHPGILARDTAASIRAALRAKPEAQAIVGKEEQ